MKLYFILIDKKQHAVVYKCVINIIVFIVLCFLYFPTIFFIIMCDTVDMNLSFVPWTIAHVQIDLARPNAMYAANSMYIANSATGVTISHPAQLPTTFPPPPAVFANRPTINLINASNDTTDGNSTITTTANSGIGVGSVSVGGIISSSSSNNNSSTLNKRNISTDTTVSSTFLHNSQ